VRTREKKKEREQKNAYVIGIERMFVSYTTLFSLCVFLTSATNRKHCQVNMAASTKAGMELATFGAGCFWGTEKFFRKQFGSNLISALVGYMGGASKSSYADVCTGTTNHAEVLQVSYDPNKVPYDDLVRFFFRMHDPTTLNRQGNDRGTQYRSVIFTHTSEQQQIAEKVRDEIQASGKIKGNIVTQIQSANGLQFYIGEPHHQKYLENNPGGYCNHRMYY
jgi:peptide-methionine (S)-S-oxide reductase